MVESVCALVSELFVHEPLLENRGSVVVVWEIFVDTLYGYEYTAAGVCDTGVV